MANNNIIAVLNTDDVLFGRGSGPNDHEGNIKFRDLVSAHKAEYMATNHRQTKAGIARSIVDTVLAKNGRFLKKAEAADMQGMSLPNGTDAYVAVSHETVMEKAKQALRQNREKRDDLPPVAVFSEAACASPLKQDLAYEDYDVLLPEPAPSLAQHPPLAAYHIPEMVVKPLHKYEEDQSQFPSYTTHPDEDTRVLRQPDSAYGEYNVQDPELAPSRAQQPPMAAYHSTEIPDNYQEDEEQFAEYTTDLPDEDEEEFSTYTTELADEDDSQPRRTNVTRSMEYGNGGGGSRRASLLGGRRCDSVQSRRDSGGGSRRGSLTAAEVWRRDSMIGSKGESMDMSDLMDSFRGMNAGDYTSSSDTFGTIDGTIDHMEASGLSKMSGMSMQSMTSLFRNDSNDGSDHAEDTGMNSLGTSNDSGQGVTNPPAQMNTKASITPGQLASLMTSPIGSMSNSGSQFMNSGEIPVFGGSSRSGMLAGMNSKALFDINKLPRGESGQIVPPER
jgi:hypothetical protein